MRGVFPPPRETDPAVLVNRVRTGDPRAEEDLIGLFQPRLLALLRSRTRDPEAARELADDVLVAVVKAVREGRVLDAARLSGFVYGTARNVVNNYLRSRRSRPAEEPLAADLAAADPGDGFERRDQLAAVARALARLGSGEREIVLMTLVDQLTPNEIARDLGLSPETVRARKSRALRKLVADARESDARESGARAPRPRRQELASQSPSASHAAGAWQAPARRRRALARRRGRGPSRPGHAP